MSPEPIWGAATASYQVEGAVAEDGRGPSIWDTFCATPGRVRAGDSGAVACDFFHRFPDDVALMRRLGLDAFRFSIAWPRVVPAGRGRIEPRGLDFYDRLVDELLEAGIEPFPTLYHWDLPQPLEDAGGWPARATAEAFVPYVEAVVGRLGDRVTRWTTHNEPWCAAWLGYVTGEHAPGRREPRLAGAAGHHLLLSHGLAVQAIRALRPDAEVGIALNLVPVHGRDPRAVAEADCLQNRWFLDPLFLGVYPADLPFAPPVRAGDLETIAEPLDFLGVNYYTRTVVPPRRPPDEVTAMGWEVYPDGLRELLVRVDRDYAPEALYVTENGAAYADVRRHDGTVADVERVAYLERHVAALDAAVAAGVPVRGYFVWSLLDNFEWAHGYSKRFGLVYVEFPTQTRVPKASFEWYRRLIRSRARTEVGA